VATLVKAARVIHAHDTLEAGSGDRLLQARVDAKPVAVDARAPCTAGADEYVPLELTHAWYSCFRVDGQGALTSFSLV
jgi:hypothetical protein